MFGDSMIYLLLYIGCILTAANNITEINVLKKLLSKKFDMMNLGSVKKNLEMEILIGDDIVYISQKSYIEKILERFNMNFCKLVSTSLSLSFKLLELQMP